MRGDAKGAFIVYRHDHDEEKEEDLHYRIDEDGYVLAAEQAAKMMHAERGGWEWSWPVQFVVTEDATGKRQLVTVERGLYPEFHASRWDPTKELPPRPPKEPAP